MSARRSTPRTSISLKPSAAATPPTSAIAPTASSTCFPAMDSSATAKPSCSSPAAISYSGEAQLSLGDHSRENSVVRKPHRLPLQLRPRHADLRHLSRRHQFAECLLSLIRNQTAKDQLRLDAQYRQDFFQIPYDPDPNDWEQASQLLQLLRPARRPEPSATPSSSPTGFTRSHPRLCSHSRPSITSTRPTTIRAPPISPPQPPGTRLRTTPAPRPTSTQIWPQQLLRRDLLLLSGRERSLRRHRQRPGFSAHSVAQHQVQRQTRHSSSSTSPIICAGPLCHAARRRSASRSSMAATLKPPSIPASAPRRNPASALGPARLLRTLLPTRAH